ncbi:MAG TPA: adenosylcobinamide amidohydrolase [Nitrospira sp.]|nr:adenosylcobinamide amidohydrolase [Nitrospira sp.]
MRRHTSTTRGVKYRVRGDTLVIDLAKRYRIVSSAPCGGGIVRARSILNHQVPANSTMPGGRSVGEWSDPARYLGRLARRVKAAMPVVGLMTAVPMTQLVVDREQSGSLLLECFCTVGVTNAVRAGEPVRSRRERRQERSRAGTINIILVTNATLTVSALIGAVQVATESKTATLINHKVPSAYIRATLATGTGTDAVVIASSLAGHHKLQYSGTHTEIGSMIGRLVGRCVERGLRRFARWSVAR